MSEYRWLATGCGQSKLHGMGEAICAHKVHLAHVRCCGTGRRCVSVCGEAHKSLYTFNASAALDKCATRGMRLCTRDELLEKNQCCKNGCQLDAQPVWTDEPCEPLSCTDASFCQPAAARSCGTAPHAPDPIFADDSEPVRGGRRIPWGRRSQTPLRPRHEVTSPLWDAWGEATPCVGMENVGGFGSVGLNNVKNSCGLTQHGDGCVIVSVGSHDEWDFEAEIVRRTCCRVEVFDCTMTPHVQPPVHLRSRVRLHHVCVSGSEMPSLPHADGKEFLAWQPLLARAGLSAAPDYLKLDAEGFEWSFLPSLLAAPKRLLPMQIALEVHLWSTELREGMSRGGVTSERLRNASATVREVQSLVKPLWAKGYELRSIDFNNPWHLADPCCAELLLARDGGRDREHSF